MRNIEYEATRLLFKADEIEPLDNYDTITIHTPEGTFRMTKAEFYREFANVVRSNSYQKGRIYHYSKTPQKAYQFLIAPSNSSQQTSNHFTTSPTNLKVDLVGDEIRNKISELGKLWRNSKHNPKVSEEILNKWEQLIDEWISDESMPLIARKDVSKKGQSFKHNSGREIIISDNTFAIWIYVCVLENTTFTLKEIKKMLLNNEIPMVFLSTHDIKENAHYTKPLGYNRLSGWKVCHIESIGFNTNKNIIDLDIYRIKEHFRKYANPKNMFVLPKEIGDLGELQEFIDEQRK